MKKKLKKLAALSLLCLPCASHAANGELWEVHGTMTSKAYGNMDMGVNRECRATDWRDKPEFKVPGNEGGCKSKNIERRQNGYAWKFECGATRGEGSATLTDRDHMKSSMRMNTPQGEFRLEVDARKVGRCNLAAWGNGSN